jgi:hypothetical protein
MLDIRTLLLGTPEDRYEPTLQARDAERAVFDAIRAVSSRRPAPSSPGAGHPVPVRSRERRDVAPGSGLGRKLPQR